MTNKMMNIIDDIIINDEGFKSWDHEKIIIALNKMINIFISRKDNLIKERDDLLNYLVEIQRNKNILLEYISEVLNLTSEIKIIDELLLYLEKNKHLKGEELYYEKSYKETNKELKNIYNNLANQSREIQETYKKIIKLF